MRILYLGTNHGTSYHRYQALKRLGHDVFLVDPSWFVPANRWVSKWIYETGAFGLARWVEQKVLFAVGDLHFDLVWVDHGQLLDSESVKALRNKFGCIVNFFQDNILYRRNCRKWRLFRDAVPEYDLIATPGKTHVERIKKLGAREVIHTFMAASEEFLISMEISLEEKMTLSSEVCFVGTWIPGRGSFIARLLENGVPISFWGNRWHKSKKWRQIKTAWRGLGVYTMKDYIAILVSAKVCLGLLSDGDEHTTRSIEIPAVGGLLCAQRTEEHLQMYAEGKEAVFWKDADECADICLELSQSPIRRIDIALRGHERCLRNDYFHEPTLRRIIAYAIGENGERV